MERCTIQDFFNPRHVVRFLLPALFVLAWVSQAESQTLRIYHIDVNQAEATLFVSPSGHTLLVDSGKNGHGDEIKAVMDTAGVTQIDHFVATHYHEDHIGGIDDLVENERVTVGHVYDRGDKQFLSAGKRGQETFTDYERAVGSRAEQLTRGETIPLDPQMSVTCISSGGVVLGEEPPVHANHENDMSVSLLVRYGSFLYFIGGDIEDTTEGKIASRDLVLDVDVYQANHHGSHTSSSVLFLEDLRPRVVIISNGNHGGFRHPRQHTLNNLAALNPAPTIFQTNKYLKGGVGGNIPDEFIGDLEASDFDGTILVTVDTTAGIYTVSYRVDRSHNFQIKGNGTGTTPTVVIESLLPDPNDGPDRVREAVTLRNDGAGSVTFAGWVLRDASGRIWSLATLAPLPSGQSITIRRNGMPMSLNNPGDEIVLLDDNNAERDRFRYTGSTRGAVIQTGH